MGAQTEKTFGIEDLRGLQAWLAQVVRDPRGSFRVIAQSPASRMDLIEDKPPLARGERLEVYANAYSSRLVGLMREDFPAVLRVVGDSLFQDLVVQYLAGLGSTSFTAAEVGRSFPEFLAEHDLGEALPHLFDLARLEWFLVESFYGENASAPAADAWSNVTTEQWARARFKASPSLRLMRSRYNVDELWGDDASTAEDSSRFLVIARDQDSMQSEVFAIDEQAWWVISWVVEGLSLGEICARIEDELLFEEPETKAPPLMEWFREWIRCRWICDITLPSS